jgi:hypothetical protein
MSEQRVKIEVDIDPNTHFTEREQFEGFIATDAGRLLFAEFGIRSWQDYVRVNQTMESRAKELGVEWPEFKPLARTITVADQERLNRSIEEAKKNDDAAWLEAAQKRSAAVEVELRGRYVRD